MKISGDIVSHPYMPNPVHRMDTQLVLLDAIAFVKPRSPTYFISKVRI